MPKPYDPGIVFYCAESGGVLTFVSDSDGSAADVKVTTGCDLNANPPKRYALYYRKYPGTSIFGVSDGQILPEPLPDGWNCSDYEGTLKPWATSEYPNRMF